MRVSSTCLVRVDRNRYSVPACAAGQAVRCVELPAVPTSSPVANRLKPLLGAMGATGY